MCDQQACPLGFVLRSTFEWREVANVMADAGVELPLRLRKRPASAAGAVPAREPSRQPAPEAAAAPLSEADMERMIYGRGLALAHRCRRFARRLVALLGRWHREPIRCVRSAEPAELRAVLRRPLRPADAGLFWALLSDPRPEVAEVAHAWHRQAALHGP